MSRKGPNRTDAAAVKHPIVTLYLLHFVPRFFLLGTLR
jgi:hypothetical protein